MKPSEKITEICVEVYNSDWWSGIPDMGALKMIISGITAVALYLDNQEKFESDATLFLEALNKLAKITVSQ